MNDSARNDYPADFYDKFWRKNAAKLNYAEIFRVNFIINSLKKFVPSSDIKILDYGCGRGWMAPFLSQFGRVTGIDFGPAGIELAKKHYGNNADFFLINLKNQSSELSRMEGQFDLVVCSEVIEHITDQPAFLKQLARLLKPNGYCVLTTPNGLFWPAYKSRAEFLTRLLRIPSYLQPTENWLTPAALKDCVQKTGFSVLDHAGFIFYKIGMPPWSGLIRLEWYWHNLLNRKPQGALPRCLYQGVICQKK